MANVYDVERLQADDDCGTDRRSWRRVATTRNPEQARRIADECAAGRLAGRVRHLGETIYLADNRILGEPE